MVPRYAFGQDPRRLETIRERGIGGEDSLDIGEVSFDVVKFLYDIGQLPGGKLDGDTAHSIDASKKARPRESVIELHESLFEPATMGMGQRVRRVVTDGPDIAEMIVQALEFEEQTAQVPCPERHIDFK